MVERLKAKQIFNSSPDEKYFAPHFLGWGSGESPDASPARFLPHWGSSLISPCELIPKKAKSARRCFRVKIGKQKNRRCISPDFFSPDSDFFLSFDLTFRTDPEKAKSAFILRFSSQNQ
ncbi:hypothetical protein CEXT_632611 [Caerostris extrusa]|uniref:Uncharacterized protein n=1 Tax=Caerostris extrusa TaxID=172846 RepID=A0AAV4QIU7_CAEEX|nr:hypothetical protein CEXT_632611 [Caerostris extrusa]